MAIECSDCMLPDPILKRPLLQEECMKLTMGPSYPGEFGKDGSLVLARHFSLRHEVRPLGILLKALLITLVVGILTAISLNYVAGARKARGEVNANFQFRANGFVKGVAVGVVFGLLTRLALARLIGKEGAIQIAVFLGIVAAAAVIVSSADQRQPIVGAATGAGAMDGDSAADGEGDGDGDAGFLPTGIQEQMSSMYEAMPSLGFGSGQ